MTARDTWTVWKTGWPAGLLQYDCRKLSAWFASRLGARQQLKEQMMNRCNNCKHWVPENPAEYLSMAGFGECQKAPQIWDVTYRPDEELDFEGPLRLKPEHAAVLAVVEDGSAYKARLVTAPDFGCVQHCGRVGG